MTLVTVGSRSFRVEPGPHHRFWKRVNRGDWEPETFAIFDRYIDSETLFLDVGAWIGSTALYGAQAAQRCVAFEPDPVAFAELTGNLAANAESDWAKKLSIYERAVTPDGLPFTLGGTTEGADSTSSALFPDRESQWTVQSVRLPDILAAHRKPGQPVFLKVDIEGGEYSLIPSISDILADDLVTAYVSFHPTMLRRSLAAARGDAWKTEYIERHMKVLDNLPWSRWIGLRTGEEASRKELEQSVRTRLAFPEELLIRE